MIANTADALFLKTNLYEYCIICIKTNPHLAIPCPSLSILPIIISIFLSLNSHFPGFNATILGYTEFTSDWFNILLCSGAAEVYISEEFSASSLKMFSGW